MAYIDKLFDQYFLEHASYVVKDRAIPDIDDGFKPVQRRILHALKEQDDGKFHKVANVVGQTMKYHPHGDQSIYGALVNLANKDLFIDKTGQFWQYLYRRRSLGCALYRMPAYPALPKMCCSIRKLPNTLNPTTGAIANPLFFRRKFPCCSRRAPKVSHRA